MNFDRTKVTMQPSSFSEFCLGYTTIGESLLDVCCGNKRDSNFFKSNNLEVSSFDFEDINLEHKKNAFSLDSWFDNVYCRFVLHAVREDLEDYILISSSKLLGINGLLFIEARSDKGELPDTDHYRRLINKNELRQKLVNLNFTILYEEESAGLSVYDGEDPVLIRFVAMKNNLIKIGDTKNFNAWYAENSFNEVVDGFHTKTINPAVAKYLLLKTKYILDSNDIPFLLVFGTLLGAYRDQQFITWDRDIDIALVEEYREEVRRLIKEGWFAVYGISWIRDVGYLYSVGYEGEYLDFYFFEEQRQAYVCGGAGEYIIKKEQIREPNSKIIFLGEEFNTVHSIEEYLTGQYGETWKIPIR